MHETELNVESMTTQYMKIKTCTKSEIFLTRDCKVLSSLLSENIYNSNMHRIGIGDGFPRHVTANSGTQNI